MLAAIFDHTVASHENYSKLDNVRLFEQSFWQFGCEFCGLASSYALIGVIEVLIDDVWVIWSKIIYAKKACSQFCLLKVVFHLLQVSISLHHFQISIKLVQLAIRVLHQESCKSLIWDNVSVLKLLLASVWFNHLFKVVLNFICECDRNYVTAFKVKEVSIT